MRKLFILTVGLCFSLKLNAQVTWADQAAQVFYDRCTECHNTEGIGPMSLIEYAEAQTYGPLIQSLVQNGVMPPWTADTAYIHYSQERVLTQNERDIILDWISDGMQEGDPAQTPPPPVYNGGQLLPGVPDMVISAPNYMSKATSTSDDYVCFVIPTGLTEARKVKAFEVIPGNRQVVHHCLVYSDDSGWLTTDTSGGCAGPPTSDLMGGYTPGSTPMIFPSTNDFSSGMILPVGGDIVMAMHYPAGSYGEWDQTKINFYFYDEPVANFREVSCEPIVQEWSFNIAANTFDSVEVVTSGLPIDYTLMSVFPHMHLLGDYIESWGVTPGNDTLPFSRIPQWDFDWQDFYWFEYMQKIPAGTTIHGKGVYNNTVTNPHNPNNPPQDVGAGLNTSDEMFLIYFHYMDYMAGDENINVDSLTNEFLSTPEKELEASFIQTYPNPFNTSTTIAYALAKQAFVNLYIYDMQGRLVNILQRGNQQAGTHKLEWDGTNDSGAEVRRGVYFYSITIDGVAYSGKLMKR